MLETNNSIRFKSNTTDMNPKIVWTDDVLNFIIKYVQATPYVWNHSHPHYRNQRRKTKFWEELTKKINSYDGFRTQNPSLTRDVLARKWNNMKSYYVSERHRTRPENVNVDDPDGDTFVWKFMPAMSFLNTKGLKESSAIEEMKTEISFSNDKNSRDESYDPTEEGYESSVDPLSASKIMRDAAIEENTPLTVLPEGTSDHNNDNSHFTDDIEDDEGEDCHTPARERKSVSGKPLVTRTSRNVNNSYYHFAMVIAQDLDQLDEDLKTDAKLEIMQIVAKHKKEHLRNERNRVIVKSEPT